MKKKVNVIGAGLAGSEAAYYLAKKGYDVKLYDIKPNSYTPAHKNPNYGELVCSNSLKSNDVYGNACGLLKEEMRILGSMVIDVADGCRVPAGAALAVDRDKFASEITSRLRSCENIEFISTEVSKIDLYGNFIIATGPLTTAKLCEFIGEITGSGFYFYDAAAPIVSGDSIDFDNAFISDRYGEIGKGDYVNCPIDKEGYLAFYKELISAKRAELHEFENVKVFEGCMPVEVMASRGEDTLRFGPLKPAGLTDPKTGRWPYACMQLRKEDEEGRRYNIVGFQTNLLFPEQKRVFSMFPALKNAEFLRYGVMHRNTYINAPEVLNSDFSMKKYPTVFFAGQITGVEGYVESTASGLLSAINMDRKLSGKESLSLDQTTVMGALSSYVATPNEDFQPMNANFGILSPIEYNPRKKAEKKLLMAQRALENIKRIKEIL
ncbi:MAG: methylenetetrahydrofolate--tRNA-(uracil(54)-C(5))-methyltransferase (FADH(2)-oxidizing) TrmFO [Clostridiales bacterium]|nr:methylenetetrahydrofolate--tRNA-(uracil(54)-C(5))-methyltransferase (FADH(2)-oxidizing) TrmFO [Clostridiales bacterium]